MGPFHCLDFGEVSIDDGERVFEQICITKAADLANAIDAKRWACDLDGEHKPTEYNTVTICVKCGAKLQAKWEKI